MSPIVRAVGVSKRFGGTLALDNVDLGIVPGKVHGLVGENGAGKSTLIKLLSGVHQPTSGAILVDDHPISLASPADALRAGIGVIQQDLRVVPALSVAENVMLGHLPARGPLRGLDTRQMRRDAKSALQRLGVELDLARPVHTLDFAQKQSIAIARALSRSVRALILDEPTAALDARETEALFRALSQLKDGGVGIVYVSHRLDEIVQLCDHCTVMRDGRVVAKLSRHEVDVPQLVWHMSGRHVSTPAGSR